MPKFLTLLFLALFSFSAFAQTSLADFGQSMVSGTSNIEAPMSPLVFLDQAPNQVNGVFADASCALCGTGQQTVADNFIATISNSTTGILGLVMWGGYYPENIPNTTDDFTILVHSDAAGSPGTVIWSQSGLQADSRVSTGVVLFGVNEYMFTFDFTASPIMLPTTGTYWIELFNNSVESGNFFWETGNLDATHGIAGSGWYTTTPGTAWNLDPATDFSITVNGDDAIVPVELISFNATANGTRVNLDWSTATETNNKGFQLERKINDGKYTAVSFIKGAGTSTQTHLYNFVDSNLPNGTVTYRLKQIDFSGTFTYSKEVEINVSQPLEFNLSQNYPNPFNPSTRISYSIQSDGFVSLNVYNLLGQLVTNLVNETQTAGYHEINFNASNLSNGLYIYRLESNGKVESRKMLLIK